MEIRRYVAGGLLLAAACLSGGCAIYSETRDKQGQAVEESWAKVDLKAQIEVPRKNLQALLDEQLVVEDELWNARRAQVARSMAYSWTVPVMTKRVADELLRVEGTAQDAAALNGALSALQQAREGLASQASIARQIGQELPICEVLLDPQKGAEFDAQVAKLANQNVRAAMTVAVQGAKPYCHVLATGLSGVSISGELKVAEGALSIEKAALAEEEARTATFRAQYKTALSEYESAAAELIAKPTESRDKVDAALTRLGELAEKLKNANDSFSVKFVSEERLASLDRFLSTYSDVVAGKGTDGGSRAAIALAVFPDLVDKARVALQDLQKPNLVPLALQKNLEKAKLDGAQRDVATRTTLIALRQAHADGLIAQAKAYKSAHDALTAKGVTQQLGSAKLREALKPVSADQITDKPDGLFESKQKLWKATALFLDAEGRLRAEVGKTRYRMTALERERSLTLAESNINQWKALIDPSVDLMTAYGASGLKSSDIQALLNSLTLLWIGVGVNK